MGGFRLLDEQSRIRPCLRQRGGLGNAVTTRIGEDEVGRIGKARCLGFKAHCRKGYEWHGKMPGDGAHGRLFGAHVERGNGSDMLRANNDGYGKIDKFGGRCPAFTAKAEDERSSSSLR